MKKLVAFILCMALVITCVACFAACNPKDEGGSGTGKVVMSGYNPETDGAMKVAMITDYGDITDQSFNQTTYEACKAFSEANSLGFKYFKPAGDSTEARVASVEQAIQEGYNVVVMPGYAFGETVVEVAEQNQNVTFIALDVAQGDLGDDYVVPGNVATFVYREEISGFMAGYAAVKEGYTKLGGTFGGGGTNPACNRFAYGYAQGIAAAAEELNKEVELKLSYKFGAGFGASVELQTQISGWYTAGTEVVFACGGSMFQSVKSAAEATTNGKIIGVDVDQAPLSDRVITSAVKGLSVSVQKILGEFYGGEWDTKLAAKASNLGAADDATGLPTATWRMSKFTVENYNTLFAAVKAGSVSIKNDIAENCDNQEFWTGKITSTKVTITLDK